MDYINFLQTATNKILVYFLMVTGVMIGTFNVIKHNWVFVALWMAVYLSSGIVRKFLLKKVPKRALEISYIALSGIPTSAIYNYLFNSEKYSNYLDTSIENLGVPTSNMLASGILAIIIASVAYFAINLAKQYNPHLIYIASLIVPVIAFQDNILAWLEQTPLLLNLVFGAPVYYAVMLITGIEHTKLDNLTK